MNRTVNVSILAALALVTLGVPAALEAQQATMTFFITSTGPGKGGELGGLAGADAHCQSLAQAVGAGNHTWRAYLSNFAPPGVTPINARVASAAAHGTTPKASSSRKTSMTCTAPTTRSIKRRRSRRRARSSRAAATRPTCTTC